MAEELEANYVLDDDHSIAGSESEAVAVNIDGDRDGINHEVEALPTSLTETPQKQPVSQLSSKENKKRKRREKEKAKKKQRAALSAEFSQGFGSVASQPPDMQVDYLFSKQKKTFHKLSEIELDEMRIAEAMLVDTTNFDQPRKEENLSEFVRKYLGSVAKRLQDSSSAINTKPGQPSLIMLTGNAQRAADIARGLRALNPNSPTTSKPPKKRQRTGGGNKDEEGKRKQNDQEDESPTSFMVAKLFARHFKLAEHQAWLKQHVTPLAVGTPQRVKALLDSGSLDITSLEAIVIDQTWVDTKQRTVFDTPETRDELMKLLASPKILGTLQASTKLILF